MPVYKCPNGKYRIGSGKCMYSSKAVALKAYAAYRAITHAEAFLLYIRLVVGAVKKSLGEDTTTAKIALLIRKDIWRRAGRRKKKRE